MAHPKHDQKPQEWKATECLFKKNYLYTVGKNGKKIIDWKSSINDNWEGKMYISLPCQKCLYCQEQYSKQWAMRCVLEAELYGQNNCFVTLTYNEENKSKDGLLVKKDAQLFLKRLRKKYPNQKIRYFMAGEYGSKSYRPHFHIVLFNYKPQDLCNSWKDGKTTLWRSAEVEKLWGKGFVSVGTVMEIGAMKYTAKYLTKTRVLPQKYKQAPEYVQASTSPGIAYEWYLQNWEKLWETQGVWIQCKKYSVPKYFKKLAERFGHTEQLKQYEEAKLAMGEITQKTSLEYAKQRLFYYETVINKNIGYGHLYDLKRIDLNNEFEEVKKSMEILSNNKKIKN